MKPKLMSDERQEQLMKAAETIVQLMNVGVDGDAATAKVAADSLMNEHEIDLVAHAVNNSRQLAHLQSSSPEDKEKPFPLIDGARVKAIKPEPWTNAEQNSGRRYNLQEEPTPNGEAKADAPDAIGIQQNVMKGTNAKEKSEPGDYHVRPRVDHLAVLNKEWGISSTDGEMKAAAVRPEYKTEYVWDAEQRAQHKKAELRIDFTRASEQVSNKLAKLAETFRRLDAPKFAEVELAAQHAGVDQQLIDILYTHAGLEQFNEPRATAVKHASSRMYVPLHILHAVQQLEQIGEQVKLAQDAWSTLVKIAEEDDARGKKKDSNSNKGSLLQLDPSVGDKDLLSGTFQDTLGIGESPTQSVQLLMGHTPDREVPKAHLGEQAQSEINQADAQLRLKRLLGDTYIGGHSLPEVVEAYNAALSVNPNFGDTELTSYMRQHLATKGGVPFDLQLRAAGQRNDGGDQ